MFRLFYWTLVLVCICTTAHAQVYIKNKADVPPSGTMVEPHNRALNFLVIGDWGRNGADHQREVAAQLGKTATQVKADFIVSAGDNFYPSGVISEHDPLFYFSYENIYTDFSLQWDWYVVLGNHDYKSNPDAQVKYSSISRRWKMPARYFSKKFAVAGDSTQQVLIAFIDTNPLIPQFYSNSEYGPNVRAADSSAQKNWLEGILSDPSPNIKWKLVVGHHPMFSGGSRTEGYDTRAIRNTLKPMFDKYGVDAFIAGHEHSLQHIKPTGKTHHFISGGGSEKTPVRLIDEAGMVASEYGFMMFSIAGNTLWMQTVDYNGNVIYKTSIEK